MSLALQCPHFISTDGLTRYCMIGRFPVDCESCNCQDKRYVEIYSSTTTHQIKQNKKLKITKL